MNQTRTMAIIAATCYTEGGRAVWQARAICRYSFFEWYEEEDCILPSRSTSIDPEMASEQALLSLHPNPTSGDTWLQLREGWPQATTEIRIVNMTGQEVWRDRIDTSAATSVQIPTGAWAPGMYFVQVQGADRMVGIKLVINR